jgi:hypothetical protein
MRVTARHVRVAHDRHAPRLRNASLDGVSGPSQHRAMALSRKWMLAVAVCCLPYACGERPDPPGPPTPNGSGSASGMQTVNSAQPDAQPDPPEPPSDQQEEDVDLPETALDAGAVGAAPDADSPPVVEETPTPLPAGGPLAACAQDGGDNCLSLRLAVTDEANESCIRLSLDNCSTDRGLAVDGLPRAWRLASSSVGSLEDDCVPQSFDPDSVVIVETEGSISWNEELPRPSDLVVDVTLQPSLSALDTTPVIVSATLAGSVPDCD